MLVISSGISDLETVRDSLVVRRRSEVLAGRGARSCDECFKAGPGGGLIARLEEEP